MPSHTLDRKLYGQQIAFHRITDNPPKSQGLGGIISKLRQPQACIFGLKIGSVDSWSAHEVYAARGPKNRDVCIQKC